MTHYSLEQWSDYVRGLAPAEEQSKMDHHLQSGCKNCKKVAGMWRATLKLAKKEINYHPPDNAVRYVMGQFGLAGLGVKPRPTARIAQLIFDSYRQPMPSGLRASLAAPWQLIYRAGTILVDVRLETAPKGSPAFLAGQVLDLASPSCAMKDISVSVQKGKQDLASTATDQFGEFHLELESMVEASFHLTVWIEPSGPIFIPLPTANLSERPS